MVNFNSLSISEDFKKLSLDISISDAQESADYFIRHIYVEYYKNRNVLGVPSEKAAVAFDNEDSSVRSYVGDFNVSMLKELEPRVNTFEGGLFYIIVVCQSGEGAEADIVREIGSVLDWKKVYKLGMQAVVNFNASCNRGNCMVPDNLEQFVLVWHSFELAVKTQDIDQVDRLWTRFISLGSAGTGSSTCNCG